eukprot:1900296-Pleurochrysis_carterae.AAC.2
MSLSTAQLCRVTRCGLGQDASVAEEEYNTFTKKLQTLQNACDTAAGKKDLGAFVSQHKRKHRGTNPGPAGVPLMSAGLDRWMIDLLHVDLNHGKLVWKWALTRRLPVALGKTHSYLLSLSRQSIANVLLSASRCVSAADVRAAIADHLKSVGLPLNLRTKDEGR